MSKRKGAHSVHRLTKLQVDRTKAPGRYADGGNLYLQVDRSGARSWLFRYMLLGKSREMGLGSLHDVDVDAAREAAKAAREKLRLGLDPLEERRRQRAAAAAAMVREVPTFEQCARIFVAEVKEPELTNPKHAAQWMSTLEAYAFPKLGATPVDQITVHDVHAALAPIWLTKNETASRVRGRIEKVWAWAKVQKHCSGDNPAAWSSNLEMLLPKPSKVQTERHFPALPYTQVPAFFRELHSVQATARKMRRSVTSSMALEFAVLAAQRTEPIISATWDEIDFEHRLWTSSAEHMKMDHPHRCPLTPRMLEILEVMRGQQGDSDLIFQHFGKPLHATSLLGVVSNMDERMPGVWVDPVQGGRRITPHGFRSSFADWAAETGVDREVRERALAHAEKNLTVAAYLRSDLLAKRRPLMQAWENFCLQ